MAGTAWTRVPKRQLEGLAWVDALSSAGTTRDRAIERLRILLVCVAWFELERRRRWMSGVSTYELTGLAREASDAASVNLLRRLRDYRGQSRFQVWAAKFAIREAAAVARAHAGSGALR
jgi:hypothetical protein